MAAQISYLIPENGSFPERQLTANHPQTWIVCPPPSPSPANLKSICRHGLIHMHALKGEMLAEIPPVAVQPWGFLPPQGNERDIDQYSLFSEWECGVTGIFDPCDSRVTLATPCSLLGWSVSYIIVSSGFGVFSAPLWPTVMDIKRKHKHVSDDF